MTNVGYDLDTSGGLMPLIRALIQPPDEDINAPKAKKTQHPYYKRPGKGHNHDSCDACQEGGDLICCDRCPASFHLGCHDPPLEESDIPMGQWLCQVCRHTPVPPQLGPDGKPIKSDGDGEKKTRSLRNARSNSNISSSSSKKSDKDVKVTKSKEEPIRERSVSGPEVVVDIPAQDAEPEKELTPMEILVNAARIMNPTQFELPREMRVHCPFPGTDKEPTGGTRNSKQWTGGAVIGRDVWGCVPLPARLCFACGASCRRQPLLQCDYCPLLFHQDCLDPPLTALPSGRWMCPNHVEQYIDWKLVNSVSATERVALWERFSGPVDQQTVKLDFIRRARKCRPLFRIRVPSCGRGRVVVPPMVRHHYAHRPPLLPSRREYVRCNTVIRECRSYEIPDETEDTDKKHIICMNMACPKYLTKNGICQHETDILDGADEEEVLEDLKKIDEYTDGDEKGMKRDIDEYLDKIADDANSVLKGGIKRRKTLELDLEQDVCNGNIFDSNAKSRNSEESEDFDINLHQGDAKETKDVLQIVEEQLKKLDERLIKLLAFQRLQQLLESADKHKNVQARVMNINNTTPLANNVANLITRSINKASLTKYGFKHVALPSELLSKADIERIMRQVSEEPEGRFGMEEERLQGEGAACGREALEGPPSPGHSLSDATVKATLCPVERPAKNGLGDGLGRPVPMRLSRLSVGASSACDVHLPRYGHCNYISPTHSLIFYDEIFSQEDSSLESYHGTVGCPDIDQFATGVQRTDYVTRHFELINYSEYGTCVNGQLYSCDFTAGAIGGDDKAAAVRAIAARRLGSTGNAAQLPVPTTTPKRACACRGPPRAALLSGWEGSAVLPHGAVLQFGCLMFVFSITDVPRATACLTSNLM